MYGLGKSSGSIQYSLGAMIVMTMQAATTTANAIQKNNGASVTTHISASTVNLKDHARSLGRRKIPILHCICFMTTQMIGCTL
mmetsp:Transcript_36961/g.75347  ORF Transcript_36961/g.75347 Transcript_36961/m.75347 type:complete len:83 (-) Transcript_36961:623-871(-)